MKKLVRVVGSICFNDKNVLITDPCYLDWDKIPGFTTDDNLDELMRKSIDTPMGGDFFDKSEYREAFERNDALISHKKDFMTEHGQYIDASTIYGDWSCTLWKNLSLNEYLSLGVDEKPKNVSKAGEFCADGGMVCVVDSDVLDVTSDLKSEEKAFTRCYIPHFTGRASIVVIEDDSLKEGGDYYDTLTCHVLLEGQDGSVYLSTQTGF